MTDRSEDTSARFAAFESWNFRVYFGGQLLSTIGTWMQTIAQAWLVLELTNRTDRLGITVALQFAPLLVFGALAGVVADRFENRRLLVITSSAFTAVNITVLQRATDPAMQGRVMSLHTIAWQGTTPIGALFMGWLIEATSPRVPFYLGGITAIVCAIAIIARRSVALPTLAEA